LFCVDCKCHNYPSGRCVLVANAISRDTGICKGRAVLFNNALDIGIFTKCIKLLKRFYAVIWLLVSYVNCCCHVVRLFVIFKGCLINK